MSLSCNRTQLRCLKSENFEYLIQLQREMDREAQEGGNGDDDDDDARDTLDHDTAEYLRRRMLRAFRRSTRARQHQNRRAGDRDDENNDDTATNDGDGDGDGDDGDGDEVMQQQDEDQEEDGVPRPSLWRDLEPSDSRSIDYDMIAGGQPSCRSGHFCCVVGDTMFMMGGALPQHYSERRTRRLMGRGSILANLWSLQIVDSPSARPTWTWRRHSGKYVREVIRLEELLYYHQRFSAQFEINARDILTNLPFPRVRIAGTMVSNYEPGVYEPSMRDARLYVFGGWTDALVVNELFEFHCGTNRWRRIEGETVGKPPAPRSNHISVVVNQQMIVFGGLGQLDDDLFNDVHIFDLKTEQWIPIDQDALNPKPPKSRSHMASVYNGKMVIFGGVRRNKSMNDVWIFDPQELKWTLLQPATDFRPSSRFFSAGTVLRDNLVIVGGRHGRSRKNQIFFFNLRTRIWSDMTLQLVEPLGLDYTPDKNLDFDFSRATQSSFVEEDDGELLPDDDEEIETYQDLYQREVEDYARSPMRRTGHQVFALHPQRKVYIYGGALRADSKMGDIWELQLQDDSLPQALRDAIPVPSGEAKSLRLTDVDIEFSARQ